MRRPVPVIFGPTAVGKVRFHRLEHLARPVFRVAAYHQHLVGGEQRRPVEVKVLGAKHVELKALVLHPVGDDQVRPHAVRATPGRV